MTACVTVIGSMNMDLVIRSPRIPVPGESISGREFLMVPGGKGANQAVTAARLGAHVLMVGRVGTDAFGDQLRGNLGTEGIDCTLVGQDPQAATGVALIVVDDAGENSIVTAAGANGTITPDHVQSAESAIQAADVLLLQLEIPLDAVIRAAELAARHGTSVVLNPAPAQPIPKELLALVDLLVPNETESELLTGVACRDIASVKKAAQRLQQSGPGAVILTLGAQGAFLATRKGTVHFEAFGVAPVDTTAAGDAFLGGLAVSLAEGKSLENAVLWGNAAGALATTKLGAQPSLPNREAVERLLAEL